MSSMGTVKLSLTALLDAQDGVVKGGSTRASWGSLTWLFVNLTIPLTVPSGLVQEREGDDGHRCDGSERDGNAHSATLSG